MDPKLATLKDLIDNTSTTVDPDWTDAMLKQYPYMPLPAILELERNNDLDSMTDDRRSMLMRHIALNSPSSDVLYRLTEPIGAEQASFYPAPPVADTPTTDQAINTFMNKYGNNDSKEEAILEKLIFNPVADYAQILASEEERNLPDTSDIDGDTQDSLINAFILKSRHQEGHFPSPDDPIVPPASSQMRPPTESESIQTPSKQDDSLLSESLAKIYIKQHRYAKAFEIISNLSLKYPEKSIYFADQLRFLQKLMINQQYKNKK